MSATYETVDFSTYIYRVLKQVHPDTGVSANAMATLNNLVRFIIKKVMNSVNRIMLHSKGRKTISSRDIQFAVRLALPSELRKHAVAEGTKAVTKYNSGEVRGKKTLKGAKAGLQFPVTRVEHIMMELSLSERKSETSAIYLAAVIEYVMAEVLELAGNRTRDLKKVRIQSKHIKTAIYHDEQLDDFFKGVIISGAVV
jgi:histone H2B